MIKPPSQILIEVFNNLQGKEPSDADIEEMSRMTLLSPGEVRMWLEHLCTIQSNRKRGAEKAATTRRAKKRQYVCICGEEYSDRTDEVQYWIGCDIYMQ